MLRWVLYTWVIVGFLACTKEPLSHNAPDTENAGGLSVKEAGFWADGVTIDSAVSTLAGKDLMEHLKGLSDYVESVNKKVQRREVRALESLPTIEPPLLQSNDMRFYQEFLKMQYDPDDKLIPTRNSNLPFRELSSMAIQIQLITMKLDRETSGEERP